ncbi:flagellar hook-length control protein FliK [Vibrio sp.]|uniref:flagellar hook-length control protein FliK n=1 Tax=Vibrio sp. TaxID=678 RepID=UPI003D10701E
MNVNVTSASEPVKTGNKTLPGSSEQPDSVESGGFLQKLANLLSGGGTDKVKGNSESDGSEQNIAVADGDASQDATAVPLADANTELTVATEDIAGELKDSDSKADSQPVSVAAENDNGSRIQSAESDPVEASQVVEASDQLLGRLEQSSKALQPQQGNAQTGGKTLPLADESEQQAADRYLTVDPSAGETPESVFTGKAEQAVAEAKPAGKLAAEGQSSLNDKIGWTAKVAGLAGADGIAQQDKQTPLTASVPGQPDKSLSAVGVHAGDAAIAPGLQTQAQASAAAASEQALLKGTLASQALAGLKNSQNDGQDTRIEESSFAQQLSSAAGVNKTAALARAEQVQPPLTLNRELAGDQLAERVQMLMSKNLKQVDIRLDPPELGRLQIRLQVNGDNTSVHFNVANAQARDVIEQSMPRLREMLAQQGVQLADTSVQQQASGQQRQFASGQQSGTGSQGNLEAESGAENLEADINLDLNVAAKRDGISYYA